MYICVFKELTRNYSPISDVVCVGGQHEGGLRKRVSHSAIRTKRPSIEAGEEPLERNEMMARGCKSLSELSSPGTDKVTSAVSQDINSDQAFGAHACICAVDVCMNVCMHACITVCVCGCVCGCVWVCVGVCVCMYSHAFMFFVLTT